MRASVEDIQRLFIDGGRCGLFTEGNAKDGCCAAVFPSGFTIITAAKFARVLHWCCVADQADNDRANVSLKALTTAFSEYRGDEATLGLAWFGGLV